MRYFLSFSQLEWEDLHQLINGASMGDPTSCRAITEMISEKVRQHHRDEQYYLDLAEKGEEEDTDPQLFDEKEDPQ